MNQIDSATLLCLSQVRTWISISICRGLFVFSDLKSDVDVRFVDIGGIVHHSLNFLFKNMFLSHIQEVVMAVIS
jgi:hypothetical protein